MSIEKNMNTRIQHKHDIEANWDKAINFIPKAGEIIVYDIDENYNYSRLKIGDGVTNIKLLSFVNDNIKNSILQPDWNQNDETAADFIKNKTHYIGNGILLEATEAQEISNEMFDKFYMIQTDFSLTLGEKYKINYNDNNYECVAQAVPEGFINDPNSLALGNLSFIGGNNTGENFLIGVSPLFNQTLILDLTNADFRNLTIEGYGFVHTLDEKFLPEKYRKLIDTTEELSFQINENSNNIFSLNKNTLKTTSQYLTDSQKIQIRQNIGAISLQDIPIQTQTQVDLSEIDENNSSYVNGVLQDRHLPWYLPIINTDDFINYFGGGFTEKIFSFTLNDVTLLPQGYFTIENIDQNVITKIQEQEHILAFQINEEEKWIILPIFSWTDNKYPIYKSMDNQYAFGYIYHQIIFNCPIDFNKITVWSVGIAMDQGVSRMLNIETIPPQIPRRSEVKFLIEESIKNNMSIYNNIDYESTLAFDTSEIVFKNTSTTSVLGQAILGQLILA